MQLPNAASLLFLFYLLLYLPWLARKSAVRLRAMQEDAASGPSREKIWLSALIGQALLLLLAVLAGRSFGYEFFALPALGAREIGAALGALAIYLGLRALSRAWRTEDERRRMMVYFLAPRTPRDWLLWTATVVAASIAEEVAYRGVGMSLLWWSLGNGWVAALISGVAFALAHWTQGLKSGLVIFAMALVMHGLVWWTETLLLAVIVHAAYDFIAGVRISRDARRFDQEAAGARAAT